MVAFVGAPSEARASLHRMDSHLLSLVVGERTRSIRALRQAPRPQGQVPNGRLVTTSLFNLSWPGVNANSTATVFDVQERAAAWTLDLAG